MHRVSAVIASRARRRALRAAAAAPIVLLVAQRTLAAEAGAPFTPTPDAVVDRMLELAKVGASDHVVDLGSGDGRLVIAAVRRHGARAALGVEIDATLVQKSRDAAARAGVADRARFVQQDLFETDVRDASVVTLYLLPWMMRKLEVKLARELAPGTRIVAHDFPFPTRRAETVEEFESLDKLRVTGVATARLFLYRVEAPRGAR